MLMTLQKRSFIDDISMLKFAALPLINAKSHLPM